jgi:hypothetical protein
MPGWNHGVWGPATAFATEPPVEIEQTWLQQRTASLESELERIKTRMRELDARQTGAE